jgi:uncharacterized protein (TIRG00374 family)
MTATARRSQRDAGLPAFVTWQTVVALAISAGFLVFLATSFTPGLGDLRRRIAQSDLALLALAVVAHYASLVLRGYRWRLMLLASRRRLAAETVPSTGTCSLYLLLCWFVNAVSWLRLGNVYRGYLVARDTGGSIAWALGSVLAERVLDLAAVLLMLVLAGALLVSSGRQHDVWPFLLTSATFALAIGFAVLLLRRHGRRLARLLPKRLRQTYLRFAASTADNLRPASLPALSVLTLAAWGLEGARLWLVVLALHLHISLEMLLFVTFAQGLLLSAPFTPGGLGVVEPGLTGILLLTFARGDAVAITVLDRAISYLSVVLVGAAVFGVRELAALHRASAPGTASVELRRVGTD